MKKAPIINIGAQNTSTSNLFLSLSLKKKKKKKRPRHLPTRKPSSAPATAASSPPTRRGAPASTRAATSTSTLTAPTGAWRRRERHQRPPGAAAAPPRPCCRRRPPPLCRYLCLRPSRRSRRPGSRRSPRLPGGRRTSGRRASDIEDEQVQVQRWWCRKQKTQRRNQSTLIFSFFFISWYPLFFTSLSPPHSLFFPSFRCKPPVTIIRNIEQSRKR